MQKGTIQFSSIKLFYEEKGENQVVQNGRGEKWYTRAGNYSGKPVALVFGSVTSGWSCQALHFLVTKTGQHMVVHHTDGLHVGIDDGRTDEGESSILQVRAESLRFRRHRRYLVHGFPFIENGFSSNELPDVGIETAKLLLHFQKSLRIVDGGTDLELVADDRRILQQALIIRLCELGNPGRLKICKCLPVARAPFQDGRPAKPCLRAFQHQKLEMGAVVVHRHTPFLIMIGVELLILRPLASLFHGDIIVINQKIEGLGTDLNMQP